MAGISNNHEKRRFTRIHFDSPVEIEQGNQRWTSEVVDISLKGILLKDGDSHFNRDEDLILRIQLGADMQIVMLAHWDHSHNGCSGFHWKKLDIESLMHLRRLLELNNGDSALLERELAQLSIH